MEHNSTQESLTGPGGAPLGTEPTRALPFGATIRERRLANGHTLKEFARRTGVSASFLSQLERGHCSVSLLSLGRRSQALGVPVSALLPQIETHAAVTRAGGRPRMSVEGSGLSYERLAGDFARRTAEFFLITMQPGEIQDGPYRHQGEEFGMVLEGDHALSPWRREFDLGRAIPFASIQPRRTGGAIGRRRPSGPSG